MSGTLSPSGTGVSLVPSLLAEAVYNLRDFGAALNGATDDAAALTTALTAASTAGGGVVVVPGTARCASGITIPDKVTLAGVAPAFGGTPGLSKLVFDLAVTTCVTIGTGATASSGLRDIVVTRAAGTIPSGSIGVYCYGGYNPTVCNVVAQRHDQGFHFAANGLTGGISAHVSNIYTGAIQDAHLVIDGWPEFYCSNSRLGTNGAIDLNCNAYVRITGGVVGGGPNTVNFSQCHFNQGQNLAAAWLEFKAFTATGGVVAQEYGFTACHVEQAGSGIVSDAGSTLLARVSLSQVVWNSSNPFLALNAASQIDHWLIENCQIFGAFTLAPTAQINFLTMVGNTFAGLVSITSPAATNSVGCLSSNTFTAGLTLAGPWGALQSHDAMTGGAASITASGALDYQPVAAGLVRTYGATFNGVSIGGNGVLQGTSNTNMVVQPNGTGSLLAQVPDSTTTGGNSRGANAVDLQTVRTAATQVASGAGAVVAGGQSNTASGNYSLVAGSGSTASAIYAAAIGRGNVASGLQSLATGQQASAHSLIGARVHASSDIAAVGDAQMGDYAMQGRSTGGAAVRLTADGAAAGSTNVINLSIKTASSGVLHITGIDTTTWNSCSWAIPLKMGCAATAGTMALVAGTIDFANVVGAVGASGNLTTLAADTTNRGVNITLTPPNSNTWDYVAVYRDAEAQ